MVVAASSCARGRTGQPGGGAGGTQRRLRGAPSGAAGGRRYQRRIQGGECCTEARRGPDRCSRTGASMGGVLLVVGGAAPWSRPRSGPRESGVALGGAGSIRHGSERLGYRAVFLRVQKCWENRKSLDKREKNCWQSLEVKLEAEDT
ncbi:hypothetical protein CFC21_052740 [Triticum aestivum]|uniref:Uncharacterized protein n=3 Tax=Triticum TaxID=4564 RepID=A0A9R0SE61_TRITD|nr:hypothetical protein CFC21_052740 [Triticum aestivum]VAH93117.1 unnamed protein product [Triticum turgidum subsp. durum]